MPPSQVDSISSLLQVISDPKAATARLNEIKAANAELLKNQASVIENQRRAAELETREARVTRREAAVAQREQDVAAVVKDLERRELALKAIGADLKRLSAA
jgi:uncharacterized protein (DUF3084 family)